MKYGVGMGSGAMIYIPSFIKNGSTIRKLIGGGGTQTHRQRGDFINLLLFLAYFSYLKKMKVKYNKGVVSKESR
jgi:hypothetical protein